MLAMACDFGPAEQWLNRVLYLPLFGKVLSRQTLTTLEVIATVGGAMLVFVSAAVGLCCAGLCFNLKRSGRGSSSRRTTRHQTSEQSSGFRWMHASALAALGIAFVLLSAHTTVNHEENWPLSSVPMFSQIRNSSWKFSCIQPGPEMLQLTRERHNFIMSSKSWFRLQAVYYRRRTSRTDRSHDEANGSGVSRRFFFETMDLNAKHHRTLEDQNSIPALREELLAESSQLTLFGGTKPLFRNLSAAVRRVPFRRKRVGTILAIAPKNKTKNLQRMRACALALFDQQAFPNATSSATEQAPNGLAERLHVAGMDALKSVYSPATGTIDPTQQFDSSEDGGGIDAFATFLNHVREWFGPPLLLWAAPEGPCSDDPVGKAESWANVCDSIRENDRALARRLGGERHHRQFLGFQIVSPVCHPSGGSNEEARGLAVAPGDALLRTRSIKKDIALGCFAESVCVLHGVC